MLKHSLIFTAVAGLCACDAQSPDVAETPVATPAATPVSSASRATYHAEVLFDFRRARLNEDGRKLLDELARKALAAEVEKLTATAHADRIGDAAYNDRLAERRAGAIRDYLVEKGVSRDLLQVDSKGAREPVTKGRCEGMGPENKHNAPLVACLQPDRRAEIEVRVRAAQ